MLTLKLALRNILGAGIRTWLNVVALSFSFVIIIFLQGIYDGMNEQVEHATIDAFYGGGQFWQNVYDPYDPLSLIDAHANIPPELEILVKKNEATPIHRSGGPQFIPADVSEPFFLKESTRNRMSCLFPHFF